MTEKQSEKTTETKEDPSKTSKPKVGVLYFILRDSDSIEEELVSRVRGEISKALVKNLYLVIHSSGGDPYPAVRIMRMIRKKFNGKVLGIVPHRAMSAATLMLFGTDAVYMSEESQLGPLDLPIEHPVDGTRISALDVVNTLNQLQATALEFAKDFYREMRTGNFGERVGKTQALESSVKIAHDLVLPLLQKVDPYHRQKALRELRIGKWYAYDLLKMGMIKNSSKAMSAADRFVTMFPDHSYGIFKEDAVSCGIAIEDSDKLALWEEISAKADEYITANRAFICYEEI